MLDLRNDALRIWQAGLTAVRSDRLMQDAVCVDGERILFGAQALELRAVRRIAVIGAGKAGAGMATALESILGPKLAEEKQLSGWVNVPADCVPNPEGLIHLHAARPAGVNEPTAAGIEGTERILEIVSSLGANDLCIVLLSGGGSALLPAPIEGISLADKIAVTRFLSAAGADIRELNTVRKQLSRVKGGGLARACRAGRLVTLIISDVFGDPLDLIASGPTVPDSSTAQDALTVLERFDPQRREIPGAVYRVLLEKVGAEIAAAAEIVPNRPTEIPKGDCREVEKIDPRVTNQVIGNNYTAVCAAARTAFELGYSTLSGSPDAPEDRTAEEIGESLPFEFQGRGRHCIVMGGECVVKLAPEGERGLGGRNQQTVLAAAAKLMRMKQAGEGNIEIVILSCGTDGEDGPTDAAGAFVDWGVIEEAERRGLRPADFLKRNDAYHFFEPLGALIKTGPTNTNVCDVRVVVIARSELNK